MRTLFSLLAFSCVLSAQPKKILANLTPEMLKEVQALAPNVRIVAARGPEVAKEIVDADAIVGINLTSRSASPGEEAAVVSDRAIRAWSAPCFRSWRRARSW